MADIGKTPDPDLDSLLTRVAVERGLISLQQLEEARAEQARRAAGGAKDPVSLGSLLVAGGHLSGKVLASLRDELAGMTEPGGPAGPPAPPPKSVGPYQIVRELGRGGRGVVFEAVHTGQGRRVALKLLLGDPAGGRESSREVALLSREALMLAKLPPHPNLVGVYEAGLGENHAFIAMEYVDGQPMSEWHSARRADLRERVRLLRDVALAIHHAHEGGILHRDLKPKNVLVDASGRPRVTDFGLAKGVGAEHGASSTSAGTVVGTPAYMSPEQAQGMKQIDRRTDIYSLGAMLYEILAGRPPFTGEATIVGLMKLIQEPISPPSAVSKEWAGSAWDKSVEAVCMKALAKMPEDRYPTAKDFANALSQWLGESSSQPSAPRPNKPGLWIGIGAAALAVVLAAALFLRGGAPERLPPSAPPTDGAKTGAVDLLKLVDPALDGVKGRWSAKDGHLVSDRSTPAVLEIPYQPPEEYDLRVVFSRTEGNYDVNLVLTHAGHNFVWLMGGWANTVFGFETVNGGRADRNPTTVRAPKCLENGRVHICLVQVRKDGVKAYLDDALIEAWKTDYRGVTIEPEWQLRDSRLVGLATFESPTEFRSVELVEVSGKGRRSRP